MKKKKWSETTRGEKIFVAGLIILATGLVGIAGMGLVALMRYLANPNIGGGDKVFSVSTILFVLGLLIAKIGVEDK